MYLIQVTPIIIRQINFNNNIYFPVKFNSMPTTLTLAVNTLIGTLNYNYYITDNFTAASLNMQIATLRFNAKLQTFN